MISDVLSDAIHSIREYQEKCPQCYDDIRPRIDRVVATMDALRALLDAPPTPAIRRKLTRAR